MLLLPLLLLHQLPSFVLPMPLQILRALPVVLLLIGSNEPRALLLSELHHLAAAAAAMRALMQVLRPRPPSLVPSVLLQPLMLLPRLPLFVPSVRLLPLLLLSRLPLSVPAALPRARFAIP